MQELFTVSFKPEAVGGKQYFIFVCNVFYLLKKGRMKLYVLRIWSEKSSSLVVSVFCPGRTTFH